MEQFFPQKSFFFENDVMHFQELNNKTFLNLLNKSLNSAKSGGFIKRSFTNSLSLMSKSALVSSLSTDDDYSRMSFLSFSLSSLSMSTGLGSLRIGSLKSGTLESSSILLELSFVSLFRDLSLSPPLRVIDIDSGFKLS